MAFCTNCGSPVEGQFCVQCGRAAAAVSAPPPAPTRRRSPLVWVLAAVLGVFVLIGLAFTGAAFFAYYKVRQAGIDPELMRRNPAEGIARLVAATHPDLEVVSVNEADNRVTLRRKSSGKYITLDLRDVRSGKLLLDVEGEGRLLVGGEVNLPEWVPDYPGSKPQASLTGEGRQGEGGMVHFTTADAPQKVVDFYERELKDSGFEIEHRMGGGAGHDGGWVLSARDGEGRKVAVMLGNQEASTKVAVTYGVK